MAEFALGGLKLALQIGYWARFDRRRSPPATAGTRFFQA